MSALLESILNGDYVSANDLFEQKMLELQEKKLVESKKQIQAEVFGGRTTAQAKKDIESRGMTPRRASDVYPDPRDVELPKIGAEKPEKKRKAPPAPVSTTKKKGTLGKIVRKVGGIAKAGIGAALSDFGGQYGRF